MPQKKKKLLFTTHSTRPAQSYLWSVRQRVSATTMTTIACDSHTNKLCAHWNGRRVIYYYGVAKFYLLFFPLSLSTSLYNQTNDLLRPFNLCVIVLFIRAPYTTRGGGLCENVQCVRRVHDVLRVSFGRFRRIASQETPNATIRPRICRISIWTFDRKRDTFTRQKTECTLFFPLQLRAGWKSGNFF